MVERKKQPKEIVSWTSWVAWRRRLEVNQMDSHFWTFCNVQIFCQRLRWSVCSILLICHSVSPLSSSSISFYLMVATHIFQKLVFSASLYMRMASWGFCVLVFDSSGEPAINPVEMVCGVPCSSGTEFLVECSSSDAESVGDSTGAPMEIPSNLQHHCALRWNMRANCYFLLFSSCSCWFSMFFQGWRCVDRSRSQA